MERDEPDRLSIRENDRAAYNAILAKGSPLAGQDNKVAFLLAMMVGFREDRSLELGPKKDGYILTSYLNDKERTIIRALAVSTTGSLDILADKKEVYAIAEKYAAGGIDHLRSEIEGGQFGTFEKKLEGQLIELLEKHEGNASAESPPG